MGKCISIHSLRGGAGRTIVSTNLAFLMAKKGLNVALLDLDFNAPSLAGIFSNSSKLPIKCYLNSYFDGRCSVKAATVDLSTRYKLKGKLLVGFSDPDFAAIRNINETTMLQEVSSVKRNFALQARLFNRLNIDYCILDTSHSVCNASINAAICSDLSIIITSIDSLDLQGSQKLIRDLHEAIEKKTTILLNKVVLNNTNLPNNWKREILEKKQPIFNCPVIGTIPFYSDFVETKQAFIAIEKEQHPFVLDLIGVLEKIETLLI
jgi:MinD-like ATPase involved in chromosome partitioning or flagellar assembly